MKGLSAMQDLESVLNSLPHRDYLHVSAKFIAPGMIRGFLGVMRKNYLFYEGCAVEDFKLGTAVVLEKRLKELGYVCSWPWSLQWDNWLSCAEFSLYDDIKCSNSYAKEVGREDLARNWPDYHPK